MGVSMSCSVVGSGGDANSASAIVATAVKGGRTSSRSTGTPGPRDSAMANSSNPIGGHPWCIRYYPDGETKESAGRIEFYLQLNHNNATGAEASYMFSLLDDTGEPVTSYCCSTNGATRTFKSVDDGWGYRKFIERKAMEE